MMQQRAGRQAPSLAGSKSQKAPTRAIMKDAYTPQMWSGIVSRPTSDVAQEPEPEACNIVLAKRKPPTKQALLKQTLSKSIGQFTRHFRQWDASGNGTIDVHEFVHALRSLKLPGAHDEDTCELLFKEIDFDGSGTLSNYECLRYAVLDMVQRDLDRIHTLCLLWDHDRSKTLNKQEVSSHSQPSPFYCAPCAMCTVSPTGLSTCSAKRMFAFGSCCYSLQESLSP